ncbi:hypothetical protein [Hymenobacter sp.]|uniref:hypothetical protein n=1 Tax=Hymenobacter sp. TaxID=1898978 RepID=UPI00286A0B30|nr:hypothetical protein [Hymenobacter sp.]
MAALYGVTFTPLQLEALATLPFLAAEVRQLPDFLTLPRYQRDKLLELGENNTLSKEQLAECINVAQDAAQDANQNFLFFLKIDSEVGALQAMRLVELLQKQGVWHPILMIQQK